MGHERQGSSAVVLVCEYRTQLKRAVGFIEIGNVNGRRVFPIDTLTVGGLVFSQEGKHIHLAMIFADAHGASYTARLICCLLVALDPQKLFLLLSAASSLIGTRRLTNIALSVWDDRLLYPPLFLSLA